MIFPTASLVRYAAIGGGCIALLAGAYVKGRWDGVKLERIAHEAAVVEAVDKAREIERRQQAVTLEIQFEYSKAVQEIQFVRQVITREVPRYVTAEADSRCVVPVGFVQLHDASAAGRVPIAPDAAAGVDAASGVALSAVAATVAQNYGTCQETALRLQKLQEWVEKSRARP